jgi:hypothetical protein
MVNARDIHRYVLRVILALTSFIGDMVGVNIRTLSVYIILEGERRGGVGGKSTKHTISAMLLSTRLSIGIVD